MTDTKASILTAKRPIGILRHNVDLLRAKGVPAEVIEQYLADNGADITLVTSVPSPNEGELARMIESEKSGDWAKRHQESIDAANRAQKSRDRLETLQGIQGGVRSFGNGLFLNYGDELESLLTGQDVNEIRQEQSDWAKRHPYWDLGLGIAGGMAPLIATGGGGALATGGAAGKTALTRAGLGALYGAGTGAIAGSGAGTDLSSRLENAGWGSLFGGGIGAVAPLAIGGVGRATGRIARGIGKNKMSEKEIGDFLVDNVIKKAGQPGAQGKIDASVLLQGAQAGDDAILNAATNLENKMAGMANMRDPLLVEMAPNPSWTAQTPSAQKILSGLTTESKKVAGEEFGRFAAQQPEKTGAGLALNNYFKNNPIAKKIVEVNKRRIGEDLTTYDGLQRIEDTLNRNLPKNLDTARAVNRNAQILDAIDDLSTLRNTLFPGQKIVDAKYAAAMNAVQNPAEARAKAYISQIAKGVPFTNNPEISLTGVSRMAFTPYVRGKARELMLKGVLEPDNSSTLENILQRAGFSTYRTLEQEQ